MRINSDDKKIIRYAAKLEHMTMSQFILHYACKDAEKLLRRKK